MEYEICSIDLYNEIIKALNSNKKVSNGKKIYNEKKADEIITEIKKNEKFDSFLNESFIEKYVKHIVNINRDMKDKVSVSTNIIADEMIIKLTPDEFEKILKKITFKASHLSDDEIKDNVKFYKAVKRHKYLDTIISYKIIKEYIDFVYSNRYQIRKYLRKKINLLKKDKDGDFIINDDYIVRPNNDGGANSPFWISLERTENTDNKNTINRDIVVKNMFDENRKETALVAEEIARQLKLPVAQYYPAKYMGEKYAPSEKQDFNDDKPYVSKRIVITPNFLEPGEELITGDRIAGYNMDVNEVPSILKKYLLDHNVEEHVADDIVKDYKVTMVYNCFINHRDCHNGNWGIIKSADGNYKIAHIFDLEGSLTENKYKLRAIHSNWDYSDEAIIYALLKDDSDVIERVKKFSSLDMIQVFKCVKVSKSVSVDYETRYEIAKLINKQKKMMNKVINKIEHENQEQDAERD